MSVRSQWSFFIDESGSFAAPNSSVVVAGLLVRRGSTALDSVAFQLQLKRAFRDAPWPPHTSRVAQPLSIVVDHHAAEQGARWRVVEDAEVRTLVEGAAARLEGSRQKAVFRRAVACARQGKRVSYADLRLLTSELRALDAALVDRLEGLGRSRVRRLREHVLALADGRGEVYAVVASEPTPGSCSSAKPDRYQALLDVALERGVDVVARGGGEHRLEVTVYRRDVADPRLPGAAVPLSPPHLNQAFHRLGGARQARGNALVELVASGVQADSPATDARLVVADFISNQARRALVGAPTLMDVEARFHARVGLRVRSGLPEASHLASSGAPRDAIATARRGEPREAEASLVTATGAPWALEQARQWIALEHRVGARDVQVAGASDEVQP